MYLREHWELGCRTCPGSLWVIGSFKASGILATHPFSMLLSSEYLGSPIVTPPSKVPEIQVFKWTGVKILTHSFQGTLDLNLLCVPEGRVRVGIGQESEDKPGVGQDWSRQKSP